MSDFRMDRMVLGMVSTNCYIVWNDDTRDAFVVDPADNGPAILMKALQLKVNIKAILLTHGHFDHIMAVPYLKEKTGALVYAGEKERDMLSQIRLNLSKSWGGQPVSIEADHWVRDGEVLELCDFQIKVIATPGHSEGGVCYYLEKEGQLFSGDTLFHGSYGRIDLPTGNGSKLFFSVTEKLFTLPDDVIVYPGHDSETTIGFEKLYNPLAGGR